MPIWNSSVFGKPRRMLHSLLVIQKTFRFIITSITERISSSGGTLLYALQLCYPVRPIFSLSETNTTSDKQEILQYIQKVKQIKWNTITKLFPEYYYMQPFRSWQRPIKTEIIWPLRTFTSEKFCSVSGLLRSIYHIFICASTEVKRVTLTSTLLFPSPKQLLVLIVTVTTNFHRIKLACQVF